MVLSYTQDHNGTKQLMTGSLNEKLAFKIAQATAYTYLEHLIMSNIRKM